MFETYRMLGREHEADLAREAKRRQQASLVPPRVTTRRRLSIRLLWSFRPPAPARLSRAADQPSLPS